MQGAPGRDAGCLLYYPAMTAFTRAYKWLTLTDSVFPRGCYFHAAEASVKGHVISKGCAIKVIFFKKKSLFSWKNGVPNAPTSVLPFLCFSWVILGLPWRGSLEKREYTFLFTFKWDLFRLTENLGSSSVAHLCDWAGEVSSLQHLEKLNYSHFNHMFLSPWQASCFWRIYVPICLY